MIYQSTITGCGEMAPELWQENMMVLFNDNAPIQLAEIAVLLWPSELEEDIAVGDRITLGDNTFEVTAVGDEANTTFKSMGHCTLRFDGMSVATLPGEIQLRGKIPQVKAGDQFVIVRSER